MWWRRTALIELAANFSVPTAQGCTSYADIMVSNYPDLSWDVLVNDAEAAVGAFLTELEVTN